MLPESLVTAVIKYSQLLHEASTPHVARWQPSFVEQCAEWCVAVESELMSQPTAIGEQCRERAKQEIDVPPLPLLLDALHQFYKTLLQNMYVTNDLYCHIMRTYEFFGWTTPQDVLIEDMTEMVHDAAINSVLHDMTRWLED
ncbi:hypothetical protein DFQ28_006478 [Apophysomyces sp. BC1034]|nr:hypothetical protein DFQ30_004295 [Apophysomyces sp. BC1015]KAG0182495.1 hypothetical protein DFQ29_003924 [Apophysomyces sp. BC1021]KAG0193103.1 hypothetical protein DFQ28_006478 [Apophysomyces sp. BC1034]